MATKKKRKKTAVASSKTRVTAKAGKFDSSAGAPLTDSTNPVKPVSEKVPLPKSDLKEQKEIKVHVTPVASKIDKKGKMTEEKKKAKKQLGKTEKSKKKIKSALKREKNKQKKIKKALKKAKSGKAGKKKIKKLKALFAKTSRKVKKLKRGWSTE